MGAELLYGLSNTQLGISLVVIAEGVRKSRQRWTCRRDGDLCFISSPIHLQPPPELPPHHRAWLQWCGLCSMHRAMQECDLCKELTNFRLIQLDGVSSLEKKKPNSVSDATMNWEKQRRVTDTLTHRDIFNQFFHSMLFVNWGKKAATCAWGSTLGGFAHTVSHCLDSALFLHCKTLLVED